MEGGDDCECRAARAFPPLSREAKQAVLSLRHQNKRGFH